MASKGTVREIRLDELADALAFERSYVGTETTLEAFRARYDRYPDLFVGYLEDGAFVGEASGTYRDADDCVSLTAIGTKNGREHEGIATTVIERFETNAAAYADRVTVASADNVEGFYRACGYEPLKILVQVPATDLPEDYRSSVDVLDEGTEDDGSHWLYVGFDEYSESYRDHVAATLEADSVNTIYEKPLTD